MDPGNGSRPSARGQALRFIIAGGVVTTVQIGLGLALPEVFGVPIQVAIPVAYVCAVLTHFSLQRWFVFAANDFEHGILGQLARYLPMTVSQYAFTAVTTAVLPGVLGVDEGLVYVVAAIVSATAGFLFIRLFVFHEP